MKLLNVLLYPHSSHIFYYLYVLQLPASAAQTLRVSNMVTRSWCTSPARPVILSMRRLTSLFFVVPSISLSPLSKKSNNEDLTNPPSKKATNEHPPSLTHLA